MKNQHAEDNGTKHLLPRFRLSSILVLMCSLSLLLAFSGVKVKAAPGDLDTTFGTGGRVITQVGNRDHGHGMTIQADGKTLLVGDSRFVIWDMTVVRYNTDGSLDTSFGTGGVVNISIGSGDDYASAITTQSDGKIIVGGTSLNGGEDFAVVRLNTDGSLDMSFGTGGKVVVPTSSGNDEVYALAVQSDGKILAGGDGSNDFTLIRLNSNGSLDTGFGTGGIVKTNFYNSLDELHALVIQNDGKIIATGLAGRQVPGEFHGYDYALARYNTDGSLDTSFGTGGKASVRIGVPSGLAVAEGVAIQNDGKIVAGGYFYSAGRVDKFGVARFNTDGTLDNCFGNGGTVATALSSSDDIGTSLALQSDGKIVVGGHTRTPSGLRGFALVRYNTDGSLDMSFGTGGKVSTVMGSGGLGYGNGMGIQSDGKIVVAGYCSNGGDLRLCAARYLASSPQPPRRTAFDFDGDSKADITVFRPSNSTWYVLNSFNNADFMQRQFGAATDKLVPADYDGDGRFELATFSDGLWSISRTETCVTSVNFGQAGDIPVPGDYDGDTKADEAVFRQGVWYILESSNNQMRSVQFGNANDVPVAADYDGDGKFDPAVYRDGTWYMLRSTQGFAAVQFGTGTDTPVAADYDGDGIADQAVYRASEGSWYLLRSTAGFTGTQFGLSTDKPVPADYDGDGKTDIAVYRDGVWHILRSNGGYFAKEFGQPTDLPVEAAFVP
jgi:hypothetical protein